jgi:flavodoxin
MKTLVTFYSRDGHTKKVAEKIAKFLKCDIDEIVDKKDRSRIIGWLISGKDASTKKLTEIENKKDPSKYDLIIIGTPVWAFTMTPAIRTYLTKNKLKFKNNKIAFFCTFGGKESKSLSDMEKLSKKPIMSLGLKDKDIEKNSVELNLQIKKFCEKLK